MTARDPGPTDPAPVTLIGMGPMARATATILLDAGHPVTIWNRTPDRAAPFVERGAVLAPDPVAAVLAGDPILVSLTDYAAMDDVLGSVGAALAGRTLVNLSSDTPERTREAAAWVRSHGGAFVAGGLMVPAEMLGTAQAHAFYSGDPAGLARARPVLARIARPVEVGDDPGLAQLHYQACLDVFLTALAASLHAIALVGAVGVAPGTFVPHAAGMLELAAAIVPDAGTAVATGDHHDPRSTALMMGATADHVLATSRSLGVDPALPAAVKDLYDRAIAAGRGKESWTTLHRDLTADLSAPRPTPPPSPRSPRPAPPPSPRSPRPAPPPSLRSPR